MQRFHCDSVMPASVKSEHGAKNSRQQSILIWHQLGIKLSHRCTVGLHHSIEEKKTFEFFFDNSLKNCYCIFCNQKVIGLIADFILLSAVSISASAVSLLNLCGLCGFCFTRQIVNNMHNETGCICFPNPWTLNWIFHSHGITTRQVCGFPVE